MAFGTSGQTAPAGAVTAALILLSVVLQVLGKIQALMNELSDTEIGEEEIVVRS